MQIIANRKTGDVGDGGESAYVQQIYVSGLNDAELSDACVNVAKQLRELGLNVQFPDDALVREQVNPDQIPEYMKSRIVQNLFDKA